MGVGERTRGGVCGEGRLAWRRGRRVRSFVRSTGETEIIPWPGVAGHPIVAAQRNVFLVRSPGETCRFRSDRPRSTKLPSPVLDETTGEYQRVRLISEGGGPRERGERIADLLGIINSCPLLAVVDYRAPLLSSSVDSRVSPDGTHLRIHV